MGSPHKPQMTASLLKSYSEAALRNADELLVEARLLHDHGHMARAYFLAVACIEEAGKALIAFDSQNRRLCDPAVCAKLKKAMESHDWKIITALAAWASSSPERTAALKVAMELVYHLRHGREPSMYTDLRSQPDRAQTPREIVRNAAARDCVRLAGTCLAHAHGHVSRQVPANFTAAQDRLFTMKSAKLQQILNNEDFWCYHISRMGTGQHDLAQSVLGYERDHLGPGIPFHAAT